MHVVKSTVSVKTSGSRGKKIIPGVQPSRLEFICIWHGPATFSLLVNIEDHRSISSPFSPKSSALIYQIPLQFQSSCIRQVPSALARGLFRAGWVLFLQNARIQHCSSVVGKEQFYYLGGARFVVFGLRNLTGWLTVLIDCGLSEWIFVSITRAISALWENTRNQEG